MNPLQNTKLVSITPPAAIIDNAAATTAAIDTAGFNYAQIVVYFGAMDIAVAAMKVQESDDSGMSSPADITGLVFGTSNTIAGSASTLPSATDDNKFFCFDISLQGRKRYLDLVMTLGDGAAGTFVTAFAILSKANISPTTAAQRGCSQILRV